MYQIAFSLCRVLKGYCMKLLTIRVFVNGGICMGMEEEKKVARTICSPLMWPCTNARAINAVFHEKRRYDAQWDMRSLPLWLLWGINFLLQSHDMLYVPLELFSYISHHHHFGSQKGVVAFLTKWPSGAHHPEFMCVDQI